MDAVSSLETALGAELLRADMLGGARPRIADRYVVSAFLGRGATGLVVAAYDETLARKVALKLSPVGVSNTIADEARALARLDHPNVVRVFDATAADVALAGTTFRVWAVSMQLVEGMTFRAWLRDKKRTPAQIVGVLLDAGAGLAAAHAQRIVHRDFKPENVLVRPDGVAQVIDFGFAVPHQASTVVTADIAGTAPYLAPEARAGKVGPRSDQYAFGITLVEALTGDPTPPTPTPPVGIEPRIWAVASRATHDDVRRRYPDMSAVLAALRSGSKRRWGCATWSFLATLSSCLLCVGSLWALGPYLDHRCDPYQGTWYFHTHIDESERAALPPGTEGIYEMALTHRGYCQFDVVLEQHGDTGPNGSTTYQRSVEDTWHVVQAEPFDDPLTFAVTRRHTVRGEVNEMTYRFAFSDRDQGHGTFTASHYSGTIPSVSRFDPDAGHDRRRTE